MHKRRADFNPLKFTPHTIHNKKSIDGPQLIEYYKTHTLEECAVLFKCAKVTIKRTLRKLGIDTNTHCLKGSKILAKSGEKRAKLGELTKDTLTQLYITNNFDTITIAEMYSACKSSIRKLIRKYALSKSRKAVANSMSARHYLKHSMRWPAQRPEIIKKTLKSSTRVTLAVDEKQYHFKSLHELCFALLCHNNGHEYRYEEMIIPYVDMLTGKHRVYVIDFIVSIDDKMHWVEIKPCSDMIPSDKRIYAERRAEETGAIYRGNNREEIVEGFNLFKSGYMSDSITFITPKRLGKTKQTLYRKTNDFDTVLGNLRLKKIDPIGIYYKAVYGA